MGRKTKYVECDLCGKNTLRDKTGQVREMGEENFCKERGCYDKIKSAVKRVKGWKPEKRNGNGKRTPGVL